MTKHTKNTVPKRERMACCHNDHTKLADDKMSVKKIDKKKKKGKRGGLCCQITGIKLNAFSRKQHTPIHFVVPPGAPNDHFVSPRLLKNSSTPCPSHRCPTPRPAGNETTRLHPHAVFQFLCAMMYLYSISCIAHLESRPARSFFDWSQQRA